MLLRSTSPHPSLSSSGLLVLTEGGLSRSEEVRCSLDELDAVIATFDEEAKQQRSNFARDNMSNEFVSSSLWLDDFNRRCSTSFLNDHYSIEPKSYEYATMTLRRDCPRSQLPHPNPDQPLAVSDLEFPPPPPDLFAADNFVLPPPPPPVSSAVQPISLDSTGVHNTTSGRSAILTNGTLKTRQCLAFPSFGKPSVPVMPSNYQPSKATESCPQTTSLTNENGRDPAPTKRPAVPQRAPSTRLSTVQTTSNISPTSNELSYVSGHPGSGCTPPCELPQSQDESSCCKVLHTVQNNPSTGCVPPSSQQAESSIDRTVPPVGDIIRKFGGFKATEVVKSKTTLGDKTPVVTSCGTPCNTLSRPPTDGSNQPSQNGLPCDRLSPERPDTSCLPSVQELARGFISASNSPPIPPNPHVFAPSRPAPKCPSSLYPHTTNPTIPYPHPLRPAPPPPPPQLSSSASQPLTTENSKCVHGTDSSTPSSGRLPSTPSSTPLSSFGGSFSTATQHTKPTVSSSCVRMDDPVRPSLSSPNATFSQTQLTVVSGHSSADRLTNESTGLPVPVSNSSGHSATIIERAKRSRPPTISDGLNRCQTTSDTAPSVTRDVNQPIQSLRLDSVTLETLLQHSIVNATQIPGFHPIPSDLPDWKVHKLERNNREAAANYAADLRKWGKIPQWKRDLIEKRTHGKPEVTSSQSVTPADPRTEMHSLISAELTEKLQRRLEKVNSVTSS